MIVLKSLEADLFVVIECGYVEASSIFWVVDKVNLVYPSTHQLILDLLCTVGASPVEAVVDRGGPATGTYNCSLVIAMPQGTRTIPCRVSDAVALSVLSKFAVNVTRTLLGTKRGRKDGHHP
jgi:bifunctional DNase/RNase